jgi:hypothetical protein|tara:strand:- start:2212 stop:2316 length:105 start_codon:yes stop_codon:yes gene_type:complete
MDDARLVDRNDAAGDGAGDGHNLGDGDPSSSVEF